MAIFALGPTHVDETERQGSRAQLDKELAKFPWLIPVALELFVGKYDPAKLNLLDRLIASLPASPLHGMPASDLRDWTTIRAWANNLAAKLQLCQVADALCKIAGLDRLGLFGFFSRA